MASFLLICVDFFAEACALQPVGSPFLQRFKMTKRAQKPKNKAFKNFSVPKSASNEREREREGERERGREGEREREVPPKHCPHFHFI